MTREGVDPTTSSTGNRGEKVSTAPPPFCYRGTDVGLLDPHGDLAREVLDAIPRGRTNEVLHFAPGDLARPMGLNLLPRVARDEEHLVVAGVLAAFRGIWGSSWGPRLEYILGHALAALLDHGGLTILALPRLLSDDAFRERVTAKIRDPVVRTFWREEYARYDRRFRLEAIAPIQNKIGRLLANAPMRNVFGQAMNRFDAGFLRDKSVSVLGTAPSPKALDLRA